MNKTTLLVSLASLVLLAACGEEETSQPVVFREPGQLLGQACKQDSDCGTGVCAQGVCTRTCNEKADCPSSTNWSCGSVSGASTKVCRCQSSGTEKCNDGVDNDCNGRVDDCTSCNGVLVPPTDKNNCGGCGIRCRSDQVCDAGKCDCPSGRAECGGKCINVQSDESNCGSCGNACPSGQQCNSGVCSSCASSSQTSCSGKCVYLMTDEQNCGSCGNVCQSGQVCQQGTCACSSSSKQYCPGVGCVYLTSDEQHCGSCGNACPSGQSCQSGVCMCPSSSQTYCPGAGCVSLSSDEQNCGTCGNACGPGLICNAGVCGCSSSSLPDMCPGTGCVNLLTDEQNCGACGKTCNAGESCQLGSCSCQSGLLCGGVCISTSDESNCGACGNVCGAGQICSAGTCVCTLAGQTTCGKSCASLSSDEQNCGACGNACNPGQTCSNGACKCPVSGELFCAGSGGCIDTLTDPMNCGGCGIACGGGLPCSNGACKCPTSGQLFCPSAGACVDTLSNKQHCGACDNACPAGVSCVSGGCACELAGLSTCGGACVDTQTDQSNCGSCGNVCPAGQACVSGACACGAGLTVCAGSASCVDLKTDPKNCGSCGMACAAGVGCAAGACSCPAPTASVEVRVTNTTADSSRPSIAWDGAHFGVAYLEGKDNGNGAFFGGNVRFALLNPDGSSALAQDLSVTVFPSGSTKDSVGFPSLVWTGSEYGLLYAHSSTAPSVQELLLQRITPAGALKGAAVNISSATPGTKASVSNAVLSWSDSYGGYALVSVSPAAPSAIDFQRLGLDGSSPLAINHVSSSAVFNAPSRPSIASSPQGWGVLIRFGSEVSFIQINSDGSQTAPHVSLSASGAGEVGMVFDGGTFDRALASASPSLAASLNRGSSSPGVSTTVSSESAGGAFGDLLVAGGSGSLVVGWTHTGGSGSYDLRAQRLLLPAATTSAATLLGSMLQLLPTETIPSTRDASLALGNGTLMAVWGDKRFGAQEIYARSFTLPACP